ncbi:MAG: hypothetical protein KIT44_16200, partial [Opitutaceae bacterium]|nr:hypothetical protein [Opitutaceae bacterium]
TFRQAPPGKVTPALTETLKADIARLEALNRRLGLMQTLDEAEPKSVDLRELVRALGAAVKLEVETGPDPVRLHAAAPLLEFALGSLVETLAENRPEQGLQDMTLELRAAGEGRELTALLSIKGKHLELEGILPEPVEGAVPNQGRLAVFLAKEIIRLHHGEIHAGPGMQGTEILVSLRSL